VRKKLSHKTVLSRRDASGMGFSMKKEQDLNPNGFKTPPAHHDFDLSWVSVERAGDSLVV
jgi:hypothetical protein